jgi:hypothetical protein
VKRSALWWLRVVWFEDVEAEGFCCCEVGFAVFDFGSSVDSDSVDESSSEFLRRRDLLLNSHWC